MRKIVVEIISDSWPNDYKTTRGIAALLGAAIHHFIKIWVQVNILSDTADPQSEKADSKLEEIEGYLWGDETDLEDLLPGYRRELFVWLVEELKKQKTIADSQVGRKAEVDDPSIIKPDEINKPNSIMRDDNLWK